MERTVVIVDDDPIAAYLLERLIRKQKISQQVTALSGADVALDYFEKHDHSGKNYLVFLDINMPDMNGWQLMEAVRKRPYAQRISFFIVTSSVEQADRDKIGHYPSAIGFLEKPVSAEMVEDIKGVLKPGSIG